MTQLVPGRPETTDIAKAQARRLGKALLPDLVVSHGKALEIVAQLHGHKTWGSLNSTLSPVSVSSHAYDLGLQTSVTTPVDTPKRTNARWSEGELESLINLQKTHGTIEVGFGYRDKIDKILADGCVSVSLLDSLFDAVSKQMGDFAFAIKGKRLVELFDIVTQTYLNWPGSEDDQTIGFESVTIADAAYLLISMERLGIDAHPERLVSAVNTATKGKKMVSKSELACLWYATEKAAAGREKMSVGHIVEMPEELHERFTTPTGYTCSVYRNAGSPVAVIIETPAPGTRN